MWFGKKNLLPEPTYHKLEGDVTEHLRSGPIVDYRPSGSAFHTGLQALNSGEYGEYSSGPSLNDDAFSFGFPGDYNDYNGLN